MIKNKEDDFYGDSITSNIKYYDNEWQAQGTTERGSMFTKEPLLHLFFEGLAYDKDLGDYRLFVPRGTDTGAKLEHDLLLLDNKYYTASESASSVNIYDIDTFAKKSFAISNPVYDPGAKVVDIPLVDMTDPVVIDTKVADFYLAIADAMGYNLGASSKESLKLRVKTRYGLADANVKIGQLTGDAKAKFVKDFSLKLHDPDSIKMPFVVRKEKNGDKAYEINGNIYSRFLVNVLSGAKKESLNYVEKLSNYQEELLLRNYFLQTHTEGSLADEPFIHNSANQYFTEEQFEQSSYAYETSEMGDDVDAIAKVFNNGDGKFVISLANSEVYVGAQTNILSKRGIVLLNEEDTSNIFQDDNNSYRLFNRLVLCYPTVDDIISLRTGIGGLKNFISRDVDNSEAIVTETNDFNDFYSSQLSEREVFSSSIGKYYQSICDLMLLDDLGHPSERNGATISDNVTTWNSYKNTNIAPTLRPRIREWLENEVLLVKAPVYGDYVEELNFMQDLSPDSDVQFRNLRVKKTSIPYKRFQDSKYEMPFIEKTTPLLNLTPNNLKGRGVHASEAIEGVGEFPGNATSSIPSTNIKSRYTTPPTLYDFDKGDEEDCFNLPFLDARVKGVDEEGNEYGQRVNSKAGGLVIEDRIQSPTIDELWTFLKYLTESDGRNPGTSELDLRLPSFFGLKKDTIADFLTGSTGNEGHQLVNPNAPEDEDKTPMVDILDWHVESDNSLRPYYDNENEQERKFGGYKITNHIDYVYDYEVKPFSRRSSLSDGQTYEFDTESAFTNNGDAYNHATGYLEKLYNDAIVNFLHGIDNLSTLDVNIFGTNSIFTAENDSKLKGDKFEATEMSGQRLAAFQLIAEILNYKNAYSDPTKKASLHNHYKHYLKHPKNLKEIERDLEELRQNLQTAVEYILTTQVEKGFADRNQGRGTLHELHRNHYDFDSTLIQPSPGDLPTELNDVAGVSNCMASKLDKEVMFDDGAYADRYKHDNYDKKVFDIDSSPTEYTRKDHPMYKPNETLLSEVYLAADGTWRSIHAHTLIAVLDCEE